MIPEYLVDRAAAYGRDAAALRQSGDHREAVILEAIRDELRKCAQEAGEVARAAWDEGRNPYE